MAVTLKEAGMLDKLSQDRDQLVCDAYKDARVDEGGAGNEAFTKESVLGALEGLYNRTVGQTLSVFDTHGFFTVADAQNGTIDDLVHQQMSDEWTASINS
jgi:hypothetical protein